MTLTEFIEPATLWRGSDLGSADTITTAIDPTKLAPLLETAHQLAGEGVEVVDLTADQLDLGALRDDIADLAHQLHNGRGLVILSGFPVDELSVEEASIMFWAIGLGLGTPVSQSVMGDRLGHVIDVSGKDPHARAYRNANELTPHTDPADILAFLCLHPAMSGGMSRFASSMAVHAELEARRPDLLDCLYRGFRYHRFGEQADGLPPVTPHHLPVFSECDGRVSCRYLRQYIEIAADEFDDINLSADDAEALGLFEAIVAEPGFALDFTLQKGEAVFANNFTVLHARSGFEDDQNPAKKRHLLRLWIAANEPRPIKPTVMMYEGEPGIPPQPGRTPSYQHNIDSN
jgi:hypothetical protein